MKKQRLVYGETKKIDILIIWKGDQSKAEYCYCISCSKYK